MFGRHNKDKARSLPFHSAQFQIAVLSRPGGARGTVVAVTDCMGIDQPRLMSFAKLQLQVYNWLRMTAEPGLVN